MRRAGVAIIHVFKEKETLDVLLLRTSPNDADPCYGVLTVLRSGVQLIFLAPFLGTCISLAPL
jgi:hypothetical protein